MNKEKVVLDTSVLINNGKFIEKNIENYDFVICSVVASELDNQKESDNPKRAMNGRVGLRLIDKFEKEFLFVADDTCSGLPDGFDKNNNDNKILSVAHELGAKLATKDRGLKIKALSIGVECITIENSENNIYQGYKILELDMREEYDEKVLASIYEGTFSEYNMCNNEYLIIKDVSCPQYILKEHTEEFNGYKTIDILRYFKGRFLSLNLPPKKIIKPLNDLQSCALDLLNNDNIPVKIIAGGFGSGKTLLATKMALYKTLDKGEYGSIMVLRNPSIEGEEIGFLPGSKEEKVGSFFMPFVQHLEQKEVEAESLERQGILKKEIIGYIKGLSIGSTSIIVDEAEDLSLKNLKMCGSRIESNSCITFIGDYKQTHNKFTYTSGLLDLIDLLKNEELVGTVVLEEDLRSEASKIFASI